MINLKVPDGSIVHWTFGPTTVFTNTSLPLGMFPNDPSTFAARYGNPPREEGHPEVRANFKVDAETLTGSMSAALGRAAADPNNDWGLRPGPNVAGEGAGFPTFLESHDFAAVFMPHGWLGSSLKSKYHDPFVGVVGVIGAPPAPPATPPASGELETLRAKVATLEADLGRVTGEWNKGLTRIDRMQTLAKDALAMLPKTGGGNPARIGRQLAGKVLEA